jgi:hypothetical protein
VKRALLACLILAGCVTPQGHLAFRQVMERQIGKQTDEPDFYPVYYRLRQVESKTLPNGNVEDEYLTGRRNECRLFFEATPGTRRVLRWRFEGDERYCVILPRER